MTEKGKNLRLLQCPTNPSNLQEYGVKVYCPRLMRPLREANHSLPSCVEYSKTMKKCLYCPTAQLSCDNLRCTLQLITHILTRYPTKIKNHVKCELMSTRFRKLTLVRNFRKNMYGQFTGSLVLQNEKCNNDTQKSVKHLDSALYGNEQITSFSRERYNPEKAIGCDRLRD